MAKIILDAGHGGTDGGAIYGERLEKDDNLRLTLATGEILENYGVDVAYIRTSDVYHSPNEKVRIANQEDGDLLVSFHRNYSVDPNMYSGVEAIIYSPGGINEIAAENIITQLTEVGFQDQGISIRTNLAILRGTRMPSVIVEVGFINTEEDNLLFDQRFDDIANAIAIGILKTFGFPVEEPVSYRYRVQVGLFRNYNNAVNLHYQLMQDASMAVIVRQGEFYAVQVGDFGDLDDAAELEQSLRAIGYNTLVVAV